MLSNVRRKIVQKDIKKYSEFRITDWWNVNVGSSIFKYSHLGKQRYSTKKMEVSFENPSLLQGKIPYYIVNNEIYNMILCTSGSFIKGHKDERDNQPKRMKIEKSFLLGETEITQELYQAVMKKNPSHFGGNPKNPVENVSWYDALIFCNKLSDVFKLDRYYTITKDGNVIGTIEDNQTNYVVEMNTNSNGFRLPTEWEWEYAAKARKEKEYSGSNDADAVAWYDGNSKINNKRTTHPMKQLKPNAWGFYDMSGNVWEWCENTYDPNNTDISAVRVNRGGSWLNDASYLRSAIRSTTSPGIRHSTLGFRVCRYIQSTEQLNH